MDDKRPFYLNLIKIHLPIGGVVSIMHRLTGVVLALAIPLILWVWSLSLRSAEDFARVRDILGGGLGALITLGLIWALIHHLLAGVRHLGFDIGWGEEKLAARRSAWVTLLAAIFLTITIWVL